MQIPVDQIHGSPTFHYISEKQPDGSFQVRVEGQPEIPPGRASDENTAIRLATEHATEWLGRTGGGSGRGTWRTT